MITLDKTKNNSGSCKSIAILAAFFVLVFSILPGQSNAASADLTLSKTGSANPAVAGQVLDYSIIVTNNGPDATTDVVVNDALPVEVEFASSSHSCSENANLPGSFACSLGDLAVGDTVELKISVQVSPNAFEAIVNFASVTSDLADDNEDNNSDTSSVEVIQPLPTIADLRLEKMVSPDPAIAGGLLSYAINVTNNGPDTAQNVVVTDNLPGELQFVSSSGSCSVISSGEVVCELGNLGAGASETIVLVFQVSPNAAGMIVNQAGASSNALDNNPDNNDDSAAVQINSPQNQPNADLALTKSASVQQIIPGGTFDYTLTVSNQGPNTANDVVVFDALPQGLTLTGANTVCTGSVTISCTPGSISVGQSIAIILSVQADAEVSGELVNTASVSSQSTADGNPGNNMASASVTVVQVPPPSPLSLMPVDPLLPDAQFGEPYSVIFSAAGGQSPRILSGVNAPPGLAFFADGTGNQLQLNGIPAQTGSFIVTVTLTDSASPPAAIVRNYQLTVGTGGVVLEVIPSSIPITQVGDSFIVTFMTANGVPPESFTSSDPLPPGLALTGSSLTGFPSMAGDFSFTIEAMDAAGNQGMRDYTLRVLPAGLLILTDALPDARVNASYGAQILAIGGVRPYIWRADSALPEGLSFSDSGFLNGQPTVAGTFIVSVTVQDQAGDSASADLSLTVNATGLINLTPGILPDGIPGVPYNVPILIEGGQPPYRARVLGRIPSGLGLVPAESGTAGPAQSTNTFEPQFLGHAKRGNRPADAFVISGTPRKPGTYRFVIFIRDSSKPPLRTRKKHQIEILGCEDKSRRIPWLQKHWPCR